MRVNPEIVRFGVFEADLHAGELRKGGLKIKLYGQPFAVLAMLLERPGKLVAREELQQKLWAADTFVDFEHGLNKAINKLREALSDSADNPRFVETVPRRGYRFIAPVIAPTQTQPAPPDKATGESAELPAASAGARQLSAGGKLALFAGITVVVLLAAGLAFFWRNRPPATTGGPVVNSIVVLPFSDLSPQKDQGYFADGMTEALIADLAQIEPLRIISRTSAMRYKAVTKSAREIAQELNVDAVVEGSVLTGGDRVRISVNLVDGRSDQTLWSRQYEREMRSVLGLQREVALTIANEIRIQAAPQYRARLQKAPVVDPEAYRFYLKGLEARYRDAPEAWREAADWFEKAVDRDPAFAPAHVGLATACTLLGGFTPFLEPAIAEARASKALAKALELDPDSAGAYLASGLIHEVLKWNWTEAERSFRRSIELNPGLSEAHYEYGQLLLRMARFDEALREMQTAVQQDPRAAFMYHSLAHVYFYQHQYEEALNQFQNALHLDPGSRFSRSSRGEVYLVSGDVQKAITTLDDDEILRASPWGPGYLAVAYEASGRHADSQRIVRELERTGKQDMRFASWGLALAYAGLKQPDKACRWLRTAVQERSGEVVYMKVEPLFASMRSDPCYQEMLQRVGLR